MPQSSHVLSRFSSVWPSKSSEVLLVVVEEVVLEDVALEDVDVALVALEPLVTMLLHAVADTRSRKTKINAIIFFTFGDLFVL